MTVRGTDPVASVTVRGTDPVASVTVRGTDPLASVTVRGTDPLASVTVRGSRLQKSSHRQATVRAGLTLATLVNPFTAASACKIFGLKDARRRLETVYFPVL